MFSGQLIRSQATQTPSLCSMYYKLSPRRLLAPLCMLRSIFLRHAQICVRDCHLRPGLEHPQTDLPEKCLFLIQTNMFGSDPWLKHNFQWLPMSDWQKLDQFIFCLSNALAESIYRLTGTRFEWIYRLIRVTGTRFVLDEWFEVINNPLFLWANCIKQNNRLWFPNHHRLSWDLFL